MKTLETLVADIYDLFENRPEVSQEIAEAFGKRVTDAIVSRLGPQDRAKMPVLSMSMLGTLCLRKLWYQLNTPEVGEKMDGQTRLKFLYGDLLEEILLFLAEVAGHTVEGRQDTLEINGVEGHRDAIIDGVLVDVKSASPFGYKKFAEHQLMGDDPFGYLDQINAYLFASQDDPRLKEKGKAAFLAIEKVMGKLVLDEYPSNGVDYVKHVEEMRNAVSQPVPPARYYSEVEDGSWSKVGGKRVFKPNGNMILGLECSYCQFKQTCWPGMKTYKSSRGPKHFTKIVKEPRMQEAEDF